MVKLNWFDNFLIVQTYSEGPNTKSVLWDNEQIESSKIIILIKLPN